MYSSVHVDYTPCSLFGREILKASIKGFNLRGPPLIYILRGRGWEWNCTNLGWAGRRGKAISTGT